jgi:hypothetical protein
LLYDIQYTIFGEIFTLKCWHSFHYSLTITHTERRFRPCLFLQVFPTIYDKTRPEVDVMQWLKEEEEQGLE